MKFRKLIFPIFNETIPAIVFTTNNDYVPFLSVALVGLLKHQNKKKKYDIVILTDNVSSKNKETIQKQCKGYLNISIRFYEISSAIPNSIKKIFKSATNGRMSMATYYRLLVPILFSNYEKVLFLDTDIVIDGDLSELYKVNLNQYYLAATPANLSIHSEHNFSLQNKFSFEWNGYCHDSLEIDCKKYFQGGLLFFNNKLINQDKKVINLIETFKKIPFPKFYDQDILNKVFFKGVKFLGIEWNCCIGFTLKQNLRKVYMRLLNSKKIKIYHFNGPDKPWNNVSHPYYKYFYKYAQFSPFWNQIKQMERKKILIITHKLDLTGAPFFLLQLIPLLKKLNYSVDLYYKEEGELKVELKKMCNVIPMEQLSFSPKNLHKYTLSFFNTILVHKEYAKVREFIPSIWCIHEPDYYVNSENLSIIQSAQNILMFSEYSRNQFLKYNNRINLVHYLVEDYYNNNLPNINHLTFVVIGSINERKGQKIFAQAVGLLPNKLATKASFYVVGQPCEMVKDIEKLSRFRVTFLPKIKDRKKMMEFYENISCLVVPSLEEPTSLVALEAMMMQRAVIFSDHVGAGYMLDRKNIFSFESGNVYQLSEILKDIILTPEQLIKKSEYARNIYLKYNTIEKFEKSLKLLLEKVITSKSSL